MEYEMNKLMCKTKHEALEAFSDTLLFLIYKLA